MTNILYFLSQHYIISCHVRHMATQVSNPPVYFESPDLSRHPAEVITEKNAEYMREHPDGPAPAAVDETLFAYSPLWIGHPSHANNPNIRGLPGVRHVEDADYPKPKTYHTIGLSSEAAETAASAAAIGAPRSAYRSSLEEQQASKSYWTPTNERPSTKGPIDTTRRGFATDRRAGDTVPESSMQSMAEEPPRKPSTQRQRRISKIAYDTELEDVEEYEAAGTGDPESPSGLAVCGSGPVFDTASGEFTNKIGADILGDVIDEDELEDLRTPGVKIESQGPSIVSSATKRTPDKRGIHTAAGGGNSGSSGIVTENVGQACPAIKRKNKEHRRSDKPHTSNGEQAADASQQNESSTMSSTNSTSEAAPKSTLRTPAPKPSPVSAASTSTRTQSASQSMAAQPQSTDATTAKTAAAGASATERSSATAQTASPTQTSSTASSAPKQTTPTTASSGATRTAAQGSSLAAAPSGSSMAAAERREQSQTASMPADQQAKPTPASAPGQPEARGASAGRQPSDAQAGGSQVSSADTTTAKSTASATPRTEPATASVAPPRGSTASPTAAAGAGVSAAPSMTPASSTAQQPEATVTAGASGTSPVSPSMVSNVSSGDAAAARAESIRCEPYGVSYGVDSPCDVTGPPVLQKGMHEPDIIRQKNVEQCCVDPTVCAGFTSEQGGEAATESGPSMASTDSGASKMTTTAATNTSPESSSKPASASESMKMDQGSRGRRPDGDRTTATTSGDTAENMELGKQDGTTISATGVVNDRVIPKPASAAASMTAASESHTGASKAQTASAPSGTADANASSRTSQGGRSGMDKAAAPPAACVNTTSKRELNTSARNEVNEADDEAKDDADHQQPMPSPSQKYDRKQKLEVSAKECRPENRMPSPLSSSSGESDEDYRHTHRAAMNLANTLFQKQRETRDKQSGTPSRSYSSAASSEQTDTPAATASSAPDVEDKYTLTGKNVSDKIYVHDRSIAFQTVCLRRAMAGGEDCQPSGAVDVIASACGAGSKAGAHNCLSPNATPSVTKTAQNGRTQRQFSTATSEPKSASLFALRDRILKR